MIEVRSQAGSVTAARPLRVGVSELLAHPGTRRAFDDQVELDGLAISTAAVAEGSPGRRRTWCSRAIGEPVTATGTVGAALDRRRAAAASSRWRATPRPRSARSSSPVPPRARPTRCDGEHIDLEPVVRDAVLLALPLAPLCADDCAGPAPDAVPYRAAGGRAHLPLDPRWAALRDLDLGN